MAYTAMTLVLIFGVILVIAETASQPVAAGLFFALMLWHIYLAGQYSMDFVYERATGWTSVIAYFDVFMAFSFGYSGVWHGIFMLDPTQFLQQAVSGSQFRLYAGFLFAGVGLLGTVGFGSFIPRGLFAELWGTFGVYFSVWWLIMLFGGGVRQRLKIERRRESEIQQLKK